MLKPLFPVIGDEWSHDFNEVTHLSTVHAIYGSRHLQKELADATEENGNTKHQNSVKFEDQFSFHVFTDAYKFECVPFKADLKYLDFILNKLSLVLISVFGPPPEVSL